ncbi:MAG: M48 family metallopeptidase, partial [Deinococcota bacterium]
AANKRYSVYLALFMVLLLGAIAYTAAVALGATYAWLYVGLAAALAVGQNAIAYWYGDQIALSVARARPANKDEHRYLVNITEAVAIGAGVPMPKLYVIDSPAPNAFATGRNPQHSTVAVTRGLIELLDRQELEGVIAHELAHVKNYDALLMSLLAATLGAIIILRDVILRMNRYGGRRRRGGGSNAGQAQAIAMILLLVLLILAPVLASIVRFAVSRRREYLADATAAYITRNPEGLARALTKVGDYQGERLEVSEGLRHMFISNPVKKLNATGLFATHPPLDERISRLQRM